MSDILLRYMISRTILEFLLVLSFDQLDEDKHIDDVIYIFGFFSVH